MQQALPYAVGVAISPVAIATTLLLLTARGAVPRTISFLMGWAIGVAVPILVFVGTVSQTDISDSDPIWIAVASLLLGATFLLGAILLWTRRRRPRGGLLPRLANVDNVTTWDPPVSASSSPAQTRRSSHSLSVRPWPGRVRCRRPVTAEAVVAFVALGAIGVAAPLAVDLTPRSGARTILRQADGWLGQHEVDVLVALSVLFGESFSLPESRGCS